MRTHSAALPQPAASMKTVLGADFVRLRGTQDTRGVLVSLRESDLKARDMPSLVLKAAKSNRATILLNNAFANPKSQPSPLNRLGREEWLEQMLCVLRIDSGARVADGNAYLRWPAMLRV